MILLIFILINKKKIVENKYFKYHRQKKKNYWYHPHPHSFDIEILKKKKKISIKSYPQGQLLYM